MVLLDVLCISVEIKINFLNYCEELHWDYDEDYTKYINFFSYDGHFHYINLINLPVPYSDSFFSVLEFFIVPFFYLIIYIIKYFIFFQVVVNGITSLISSVVCLSLCKKNLLIFMLILYVASKINTFICCKRILVEYFGLYV